MATPTSLDGFFRHDEDSLTEQFAAWWAEIADSETVCAHLYFKPLHGGKMERVTKPDPSTCSTPTLQAVDPFVAELEERLCDRHGDNPMGYLRCQAYIKGNSRVNVVDMQRTIVPPELPHGDPSVHELRQENTRLRQRNALLEEQSAAFLVQAHTTIGMLAEQLSNAATTRTVSSASGDMASLASMLAFGLLLFSKPAIMRFLDLPTDATLPQIRARVLTFLEDQGDQGAGKRRIPLQALAEDQRSDDGEEGADDGDGRAELQELVDEIKHDGELVGALVGLAEEHPRLQKLLELA